ncbi:MAG: dienelactone hydrolase family protein [Micropepsaceae bacterium]
MIDRQLDIRTDDAAMSTFITHPERGGPFPVVLFYMDAPAIREELRDMARRLGSAGYYVMLPNLYYRSGVMELGPLPTDMNAPERVRMFQLMESLTIQKIMSDTKAMIAFAAADPMASNGPMGAVGYCMSGQYAINAAANFPDRIHAAASVYGVKLVMDTPDSPHTVAARVRGELYIACAETDRWLPPEQVVALQAALKELKVKSEVEVYAGTEHGFAFPARAAYNKQAAETHWERLHSLFRRNIG